MIEYFKADAGTVVALERAEPGCWINLVNPTRKEIDSVIVSQHVDAGFINAALDPEETSRVELEDDQALLIVDIPVEEESDSITRDVQMYATLPMGIVVAEDVVITVCLEDTSVTRDIASGKVRGVQTAMRTRFVFQLLLRVAGRFLNYLHRIERSFTDIERRLYDSLRNEELMMLLGLQKSLVYFSASLKGNEVTMEKVLRGRILKLYEDDRDLLEDALIEIRQAIEMAGIYSSILAGTMETYSSVVSNNMNDIMKALTVITLIMTIPNMVFGFYGMNVSHLPGAISFIPVIIAVIGCIVAWQFLKKHKLY
ncbi:magnesium transporter CorA family protein [Butyricicoccus porcorum]|uniref:Magnesium transporter n=1 Tax=Butyricicoccus porcorum TaxID=1945634 RepID=A0A252F5H4_9FIRM|nr:magnesium transporter CorA family protein [Butyricicoccus porcorum]MCI6927228.1 magnesium transporter CorA family protein [Butyricicoccus porcorum]MDD6986791.1 magnesium transporter CorA family protein [Butyricicoccus porcorum]MDY4483343.1 magnesium transporter CorA family protein [Butyricicoccus porcorum]OUM21006.1 magnesium transporter [Butyricicoccus porcorum]